MISTLLFDADGVLIRTELASRYFEEKYGINRKITISFYKGPFLDCLLGKREMSDVLPDYLKQWGWQKTTEDFVQEWFDFENKVDVKLIAYIQKLRQKGIRCYVATNQERQRATYMLERMGFAESFDNLFASAHLGSAKPDAAFFEKLLRKLGIADKQSILFWDDMLVNVEAAQEFGIHAEHYSEFDQFKTMMGSKYDL
jgi:putative hydrolase of the HAD superfamily